jgi:predicted dehydrogenase
MRVGIIGAGRQGRRRATVVRDCPQTELVVVSSADRSHAQALASRFRCEAETGWRSVIDRSDLDIIVVCTPPHLHAEITIAALESGKHVLCEKPLSRTEAEGRAAVAAAERSGKVLKCGFNHRHHPGVQQVRRWVDGGAIGPVMLIRCTHGMCGHAGYDREWRADPEMTAGGHLMEQGIHAIDLFRWLLGDPDEVTAVTATLYWEMAPKEDNAFVLLRWPGGQIASLHSSLTQWKNLFSYEVYGKDGYAAVNGLGGGYGVEQAVLGKRDWEGPFAGQVVEFRGEDRSWWEEWREFVGAIEEGRAPLGSGVDGLRAIQIVNAAYAAARERRTERVPPR